jgi:hypothetical protein
LIVSEVEEYILRCAQDDCKKDVRTRKDKPIMRVFYASKHQLDANGSTIPEIHRDIIVLGACAYCLEAYQIPTNDGFEFEDGALPDRIDDTKIPGVWLSAAQNKITQLARLEEIKRQRDYVASSRAHWGDISTRWPRL